MRTKSATGAAVALLLTFGMAAVAAADGSGSSARPDPFGATEPLGAKELGDAAVSGGLRPGSSVTHEQPATAEGACTASGTCAANAGVRVDVSGGEVGDVTVGSFNTRTGVSATNVLDSRFETGTLSFGATDPAGPR